MRYLWDSEEAAHAREYLAGRGLDEGALREFRVGYAPSAWDKVLVASRRTGFSDRELVAAGLASRSQKEGRTYDRFRRRIMFPLCDQRGRVLGFGARAMGADQKPKYLNSSDGEVFHKGRHLFGADIARAPAAKAGEVIVAEGYTDVIAMHQAGLRNTVGLMGTALTDEQVGELARLAPTVLLALDADARGPGGDAARRARRGAAQPRRCASSPLPAGQRPRRPRAQPRARGRWPTASTRRCRSCASASSASWPAADLSQRRGQGRGRSRRCGRCSRDAAGQRDARGARSASWPTAPSSRRRSWPRGWRRAPARAAEPARRGGNGASQRRPAMPQPRARRRGPRRARVPGAVPGVARRRARGAGRRWTSTAEFSSDLMRRAAAHVHGQLAGGGSALPHDDDELATLIAALTVLSGGMRNSEAAVEGERLSLEVQRVKREIEVAKAAAAGDVGRLVALRQELERRRDGAIARAMEETHATRLSARLTSPRSDRTRG